MNNNSRGSIILSALVIGVIMVIGYIVISNLLASDQAQDIQEATEQTVDTVNDVREQIDTTKNAAQDAIDSTTELIDQVTP